MKAFLPYLLALVCSAATAQEAPYTFSLLPLDSQTQQVVYSGAVPVANASKAQLFSRAQGWAAQKATFRKAAPQRIGPEAGVVSTHITLKTGQEAYGCLVSVSVKDSLYHYQLHHVTYTKSDYARAGKYSTGPTTTRIEKLVYTRPNKYRDKKLAEVDTQLKRLIYDLQQAMLDKPTDGLATQL
ncbi:hypothetical protein HMJ29_05185 [Hymenobacter taeanensis]|uniref:DUF4468 domain-containing protein n=1 Tax=Hymenobacter taeanensis TaxID=2735321 RepID=A0A6M6BD00_9BACT|nr:MULTISPECIES: hypothetical protein [Hymenobacter]QJX46361.1 hypothetical protein HMJ29_05185 [Hymenobacter taeanensis]UOQ80222.1 hypothetical protein MUN83_15495 [Hymenobacter sp. 5414T-23]